MQAINAMQAPVHMHQQQPAAVPLNQESIQLNELINTLSNPVLP